VIQNLSQLNFLSFPDVGTSDKRRVHTGCSITTQHDFDEDV